MSHLNEHLNFVEQRGIEGVDVFVTLPVKFVVTVSHMTLHQCDNKQQREQILARVKRQLASEMKTFLYKDIIEQLHEIRAKLTRCKPDEFPVSVFDSISDLIDTLRY